MTDAKRKLSISEIPNQASKKQNTSADKDPEFNMQKASEIMKIITQVQGSADLRKETFQTAVFGKVSSGKTSFLRRFLRTKSLPTSAGACTGCPTKIHMLTGEATAKFRLIDDADKAPMSFNDEAAAYRELGAIYAPFKTTPNYGKLVTMKIADPDALPIAVIDTPGPRMGNDTKDWIHLTANVDGNPNPCVITIVKWQGGDITGGTLQELYSHYKDHKKDLTLLVVITGIDLLLADMARRNEALEEFKENVKKIHEGWAGANLHIFAVQCMDETKPNAEMVHQETVEQETISKLPRELLDDKRLKFGMPFVTSLLMKLYLKFYDGGKLIQIKQKLEAERSSKIELRQDKSVPTDPTREYRDIAKRLDEYQECAAQCEAEMRHFLDDHLVQIADTIDLAPEAQTQSNWSTYFGLHSEEVSKRNLDKARGAVEKVFSSLAETVPDLASACAALYLSHVQKTISNYEDKCPDLHSRIQDFAKNSMEFAVNDLTKELRRWARVSAKLTMQRSGADKDIIPFSANKFSSDKKNPVAQRAWSFIQPIMGHLIWTYMALVIERLMSGFPQELSDFLFSLKQTWAGASEMELAVLDDEIKTLERDIESVKEIIKIVR